MTAASATALLCLLLLCPIVAPAANSFDSNDVGLGVWIGATPNSRGGRGASGIATQSPPPDSTNPAMANAYTALQAWKSSITEDTNGILSTWVGPNVCSYKGIFCSDPPDDVSSSSPQQVVAVIDLNRASLKGTLVKELSLLTHLSSLHLNSNRLKGTIPATFKDFQYLSELDLSNNLLSGPFPTPVLSIPNLAYLDLRFNAFTGSLPDDLFDRDNLDAILLNNNAFEGEVPATLWTSPASVVTLANNRLSGTLPWSFGYVGSAGLREVLLLNNSLTGCIPDGIGFQVPDAEILDFSFNSLAGRVPATISCLQGIEVLNVAHNRLSGVLPEEVCSLRSLVNLTIAHNFFSGLSQGCAGMVALGNGVGIDFSENCIPGRGMQRPRQECEGWMGGGGDTSCFRIPVPRGVGCVAGFDRRGRRGSGAGRTLTLP